MGKDVIDTTVNNRANFLALVKDLMAKHKLTADQVLYILSVVDSVAWNITKGDLDVLKVSAKGIIKKDGTIDTKKLFGTKESQQVELSLLWESVPNGLEETIDLADKLHEQFVDSENDPRFTDEKLEEMAHTHFRSDKTAAKYYSVFQALWPVKDSTENKLWNEHFGINFDGVSRWTGSDQDAKKFHAQYRKKDIGFYLSALYYYIKDGVDAKSREAFVARPGTFFKNQEYWYNYAKTQFSKKSKKRDKPKASL